MNISIIWTFSTWKTTLAKKLIKKKFFKESWYELITDVERRVFERLEWLTVWEKQKAITYEQISKEKWHTNSWIKFISDNSVITALAYTRVIWVEWQHKNMCEQETKRRLEILNHKAFRRYHLYIYLPIEFEIEKDWVRHEDKVLQVKVDEEIKKIFKEFWINFFEVKWTIEQRAKAIQLLVEESKRLIY